MKKKGFCELIRPTNDKKLEELLKNDYKPLLRKLDSVNKIYNDLMVRAYPEEELLESEKVLLELYQRITEEIRKTVEIPFAFYFLMHLARVHLSVQIQFLEKSLTNKSN